MKIQYKLKVINNEIQKRVIREIDCEMEIHPQINKPNQNFMETPESMKFIYLMMRKEAGTYKYRPEQIEKAAQYMQQLSDFDPHNLYTIDKQGNTITKESRTPQPLLGELADLEDRFVNDRRLAAGNRQQVVWFFDEIKRGYLPQDKEMIDKMRRMILGNDLFSQP